MTRIQACALSLLVTFAAVALAHCGPAQPAAPSAPVPPPTPIIGVSISGASQSLTVGQSLQLTARVTLPDGAQKIAAAPNWTSSDPRVVTVSPTGVLSVVGAGVCDVVATVNAQSATVHVSATWDIIGLVHEAPPTATVAVAGARVVVQGGSHNGETVMTDNEGRFTLHGIEAPGFTLAVIASGYDRATYGVTTLPADQAPDIALVLTPPSAAMSVTVAGQESQVPLSHRGEDYLQTWADVSPVTIDLSASVGARLQYRIDFGDGGIRGTTSAATHTYTSAAFGPHHIIGTVTDGWGRTASVSQGIAPMTLQMGYPFENLYGYWRQYHPFVGPDMHCEFWGDQRPVMTWPVMTVCSDNLIPGYIASAQPVGVSGIRVLGADGTVLSGTLRLGLNRNSGGNLLHLTIHGGRNDGQTVDVAWEGEY